YARVLRRLERALAPGEAGQLQPGGDRPQAPLPGLAAAGKLRPLPSRWQLRWRLQALDRGGSPQLHLRIRLRGFHGQCRWAAHLRERAPAEARWQLRIRGTSRGAERGPLNPLVLGLARERVRTLFQLLLLALLPRSARHGGPEPGRL